MEQTRRRSNVFGRRIARPLKSGQQARLTTVLDRLAIPIPAEGRINPADLFPEAVTDVWLEIGFGAGEHTVALLERHQTVGMIGCEPFVNGLASATRRIEQQDLERFRIHPHDAMDIIPYLSDASIGRAFLLFPDPWPKRRHHKRRFLQPETLDHMARILANGAELRMASDHPSMITWMLRLTRAHRDFVWLAQESADWMHRPEDWPPTRYEAKRLHGRPVYLRFRRRRRSDPTAA